MSRPGIVNKAGKPKLIYFPLNGRAALARLIFSAAGKKPNVDYTDEHIEMKDWPTHKPDAKRFPMGSIPVLEINGTVLFESAEINRYLGEEYGLTGDNALSRAKVNIVGKLAHEILDPSVEKLGSKIVFYKQNADETKKEFLEKHGHLMDALEKGIKLYGSNGFSAANKLTWADLSIFLLVENIKYYDADAFHKYPEIRKVHETVSKNTHVAEHMKSRPPRPI